MMVKEAAKVAKHARQTRRPSGTHAFVRYADYLEDAIASAPKRTKGERTKDMLKLGAIRVLDDVGYHAMRVSDICEAAGVAASTFYLYFENKEQVTRVVLAEYLDAAMEMMAVGGGPGGAFAAIRASHLKWLEVTYANAGLMRCILQLGDEVSEFRDLAHATNKQWYERIAQSILREHGPGAISADVALFAAYALGSMMDELARKLVIHPDPSLGELKHKVARTNQELADFLAVIWYQALYGPVPDSIRIGKSARAMTALFARETG